MITIPHYTKVITLGSFRTENALVGEVIVQEKVDGSLFRFGLNRNKDFLAGTKETIIHHPEENKMFKKASEYVYAIQDRIKDQFPANTYFYGEYLQKPKHNVLNYERVPKNHIVLFDVLLNGKWVDRRQLEAITSMFEMDVIPELYKGIIEKKRINTGAGGYKSSAIDFIKRIIETTPSFLGKEMVEGVVIKNYNQTILLGGNIFPLFTKYVREKYKERHNEEWKIKSSKGALQEFIGGFKSEARWQKAVIHLKEKGELTNSPKDIGKLICQVKTDIKQEEKENIKEFLYNKFVSDILRTAIRGLPEWYKEKLLENIK